MSINYQLNEWEGQAGLRRWVLDTRAYAGSGVTG